MSAVNLVLEIALNSLQFFFLFWLLAILQRNIVLFCFFPVMILSLRVAGDLSQQSVSVRESSEHSIPRAMLPPIAVPCWESLICPTSSTAHLRTPGPEPSDADFTLCPLEQMAVFSDNSFCWGHDPTGKQQWVWKPLYKFFFSFNVCSSSPWAFYSFLQPIIASPYLLPPTKVPTMWCPWLLDPQFQTFHLSVLWSLIHSQVTVTETQHMHSRSRVMGRMSENTVGSSALIDSGLSGFRKA